MSLLGRDRAGGVDPPDIEVLDQLHRAGWSIGDVAFDEAVP